MNCNMHLHHLSAVALVVILLATAGCKFMSLFNNHTDSNSYSSSSRLEIRQMPSVTTTDVDATGRKLTSAGLTVMVKRQGLLVSPKAASGLNSFMLPEIVRPFKPSQWNHMIAAQDPPPGTPMRPDLVITLTGCSGSGLPRNCRWLWSSSARSRG
jgi:hypothetical protein